MIPEAERPFAELPAGLVEELLERSGTLSHRVGEELRALRAARQERRQALRESGLLQ
jgi:hypothetical protein